MVTTMTNVSKVKHGTERIYEKTVDSHAAMREAWARLLYEMDEAAKEGKELIIEFWKERR